ncbi:hypothetical protein BST30_13575 [Mycobacterium mantenii]|uniref:Uncharacterized protein n=1 Tax=Mycobacterium mantenii TaxID=560555 RepID=A0A1X0FV92_MYCNT|nr:hypothetical protein BST30_13575 [Mycobacterium mantenii]
MSIGRLPPAVSIGRLPPAVSIGRLPPAVSIAHVYGARSPPPARPGDRRRRPSHRVATGTRRTRARRRR